MDIKKTDYLLLNYLHHNHTESLSKIAKNTNLSRDQVEYRIKKYLSEGLIIKFFPIINWSKLGYTTLAIIFLKFEKPKMAKVFSQKLYLNNKNCTSYGKIYGQYDLYLNCIFENELQIDTFMSKLFENENQLITKYIIIKPQFIEFYALKFFDNNNKEYLISFEKDKKIDLDKIDLKILKILSENGRTKLIDIAKKTNITSEVALYRIKKLKKDKIILGNRIQFNMSKLGYFFTIITLDFRLFSEKNKLKIKSFARSSKNINMLLFNLHNPNCIIQLFYKEEKEIQDSIEKIRDIFNDEPIEINIFNIGEDEEKINPLPFLS